jgi:phospholipid/cholesterol/gamma-HCH transport system substrate-binding protein
MNRISIETVVGFFLILGLASFSYLAVKMGDIGLFRDRDRYTVTARFDSISGLKEGAFVEMAGVRVGTVGKIHFDHKDYEAVVELSIPKEIELQEDSIASIRTNGIIGDKFIKISVGGADELIPPGGEIMETESAISLEELISKYIFEAED